MKIIKEDNHSYKSGDRYYGGLPAEPSASEYAKFMKNSSSFSGINKAEKPTRIFTQGTTTMVLCPNCGYEFKKAPRCPECGQLIDYDESLKEASLRKRPVWSPIKRNSKEDSVSNEVWNEQEVFDFLDEQGEYTDYNQKVEDVMEKFGLSKTAAEQSVWNWTLENIDEDEYEYESLKEASNNYFVLVGSKTVPANSFDDAIKKAYNYVKQGKKEVTVDSNRANFKEINFNSVDDFDNYSDILTEDIANLERVKDKKTVQNVVMADAEQQSKEANKDNKKLIDPMERKKEKPFMGASKQPLPKKVEEPKANLDESLFEDYDNTVYMSDNGKRSIADEIKSKQNKQEMIKNAIKTLRNIGGK